MQQLFNNHYPSLEIEILGVNEVGLDGGNASFCQGRDIPWLQDADSDGNGKSDLWYDSWDVAFRDVIIVDEANDEVSRFNLSTYDLGVTDNFIALRDVFVDEAATPPETEWQSPIEKLDVDMNGFIAARDALLVINHLHDYDMGVLPPLNGADPPYHYDATGEGIIAARDALLVINHLIFVNDAAAPTIQAPLAGGETMVRPETSDVAQVALQDDLEQPDFVAPSDATELSNRLEQTVTHSANHPALEVWEYDAIAGSVERDRTGVVTNSTLAIDAAFADLR